MRKLWIALVVGLIGAGGAAFAARQFRQPATTQLSAIPQPVPVVAATVLSHDVPIYLRGVGTVIAHNNVIIRSQITGQLVKISFKQGQTVKNGDILAEIDPRPYQAQLDQAIANRDRDQAQVVNAQANLNRYEPLAQNGWASTQLVDTTKAQLAQLQAMVKSDEGVIAQARTNLSYTQLTSPIDGVTGIRQVDNGNIIHPTDANGLVDVTQIQPISLIFSLPQTDFVEIQRQMTNRPLKVLAYSQDDSTELDEGKLDLIDNQIVQTTGTIRLRAEFPNAKRLLWPGELVNARLLLETRHNGLTIPAFAIQQGPQGSFVWVIGPDDSVATRSVKVASISDGDALIDSGLQANERVVVDGQYRLQAGTHVTELVGAAAQGANLQSSVEQEIP
ncbi:efflux RND transporter periplasmic adaptor subunit [Bradyrhizobium sp. 48]|uniref:efflux RND transporter periplasmic adaptor subunit n=1 Tax=Bradyrhizobium sp. 48 TaxID=2782676 RepID=UPI001FF8B785|nr:efflux RND transporter periplasmic adaptor subunit [Bradyrhizobium sp. 48]MCK1447417.1 efflux RND transporter periplasmic adaptor subunit [Bradyrhizobium sp. 48]